ncbi:MAG: DUF554 domain-containing protein [Actinobacteria bacterium]|nr:DUF554 domain-containing protein [Actinomycetota bacterium]
MSRASRRSVRRSTGPSLLTWTAATAADITVRAAGQPPPASVPVRLNDTVPHLVGLAPLFIGVGTVTNVGTVLAGGLLGLVIGNRLPERTRTLVTQSLGLITTVLALMNAWQVSSSDLAALVGRGVGMVVLVMALLFGSILGSALRLQDRVEGLAGLVSDRLGQRGETRQHLVTAIVTPTLLFCIGPLTIVGSLSDGLGRGADQLVVKSVLDGFAAIAFASSLGVGVLLSAGSVALIQGALTLAGFLLGDVLPTAYVDVITATGGVILLALALGLLDVKRIRVAELLPALVLAPLLLWGVATVF